MYINKLTHKLHSTKKLLSVPNTYNLVRKITSSFDQAVNIAIYGASIKKCYFIVFL